MPAPVYVIGHKNPDSDSICSAVGYATLLQLEGNRHAVPARQGVLRRETAFILQRFGVPSPALVTDVRPRVADVMTAPATCVHMDDSLYEAGQLLQSRGIRVLPVVDDECRLQGVLGVEDFARTFLADLDANHLDHVPLDLGNVVRILSGTVLVDVPGRVLSDRVMVGAMQVDSMVKQIEPDILLVMGDREDAQRAAIDVGVGALVVTGAHPVNDAIIALARERKVTVISVPHHTYATVRLIHLSAAVKHIMRTEVPTCGPDDLVDDVRDILRSGKARSLVVIDHERRVVGIVSRSNLLHPVRRQLFLVDHNERGQAVAGIEQAEVLGVIDHHRVADFQTNYPPFMRLEPLGSTSTIVAKLFAESGIAMPEAIAGVLLSGILADTLLFRGPTTTPEDRRVATVLAGRAGVDMHELGTCILVLASDVSDRSAAQLLTSDFKDLSTDGSQFGIGVFETTNDSDVLARREELL
ncbi:MAG: putative manganese-dependent inorganic diphosphatase, partial [Chloroflexi bacterium]|nr:putative manganese-dependent inorganic diphosphatase [Chloroflexota bacterium]